MANVKTFTTFMSFFISKKLKSFYVLPPHWRQQWQNPFEKIPQLTGKIYRAVKARKTFSFEWENKTYFVKWHEGIGWREIFKDLLQGRLPILGAQTEWKAIQRLDQLGIPTTPLVGYGKQGLNPAQQHSFIITAALENYLSLETVTAEWQKRPPSHALKYALIRSVAHIARTLHSNGMNHRDFYLCHFLVPREIIEVWNPAALPKQLPLHLIDLHRTQIRRRTPLRWIIKDLAGLYFSAMDANLTWRDYLRFMLCYSGKSTLRQQLKTSFWLSIQARAHRLYDKTFFSTTQALSFWKKYDHRYADLLAPLTLPTLELLIKNADILKHDRTTTVAKTQLNGHDVVIKRYNRKSLWHGITRAVRPSRAARCFESAQHLKEFAIDTPKAWAAIEQRFLGCLRGNAYYISDYLHGIDAAHYFAKNPECVLEAQSWKRKISQTLHQLAMHCISHGDLKATNLYFSNERLWLLDLDAMQFHRSERTFKKPYQKDRARFSRNEI